MITYNKYLKALKRIQPLQYQESFYQVKFKNIPKEKKIIVAYLKWESKNIRRDLADKPLCPHGLNG